MVLKNDIQRRIARSKQSERDLGKWLLEHDGEDPRWRGISSSTGRIGHITSLQFDCVSKHYAAENKQIKLPARMLDWWLKIVGISVTQGKDALLSIESTNVVAVRGVLKKPMRMHIITADRHAQLLAKEKIADATGD